MAQEAIGPRLVLPASLGLAGLLIGVLAGVNPPLAVVAALAMGLVPLVFVNLFAGLVLFTLVNFVVQVPGIAGAGLSVSKLLGGLLLVSWIATMATRRDRRDVVSAHPLLTAGLVLLVGWAAISYLWAEDPSAAIEATSRLALNATLFLIIFSAVQTRREMLWVIAAFVAGTCTNALYGLFFAAPNEGNAARLSSSIAEPGELAAACAAGLALSLGLWTATRDNPPARAAAMFATALCAGAVFLTGSRAGLIAVAVALAAFLVISPERRGRLALMALLIVGAGLAYFNYVASEDLRAQVSSIGSGSGRVDLWTVGWRMVEANAVQGVGAGNFPVASIHYLLEPGALERSEFIVGTPKVAHNTYLETWAETGIVGLSLFVLVIIACLRATLRAGRVFAEAGDEEMRVIANALFVAIVAFLAAAFFASRQYSTDGWLLLGLAPAMLYIATSQLERLRESERGELDAAGAAS